MNEKSDFLTTASIVVYNSPFAQVREAAECILRADVGRLRIVFNGSDTSLFEELRTLESERVSVMRVPNRGFGAGHNEAIRLALGEGARYHLVANADTHWEGDAITPLLNVLESRPDVGLIAPRAIYPDGSPQATCRMLPNPAQLFLRRFIPFAFRRLDSRYLLEDLDHSRPIDAPYLLGCFMLFRCDALRQEGLFDERFFMYPEDIDITRRIHRNHRTLWWPGVTIVHDHARESARDPRMLRIHLRNMAVYFNKWGWIFDSERRRFNRALRKNVN